MKIKTKNVLIGVMSCVFAGVCAVSVNSLFADEKDEVIVSYAEETSVLPEESTADFAMMNGASVRYSIGSTGLRFMAYMTEDKYTEVSALEDISFGMVIMPYEYVTNESLGDIEVVNEGVSTLNPVYYWGEEAVEGKTRVLHYEREDLPTSTGRRGTGKYFQCAITNLKAKNYDREFYAKAYYSYTENGETKYVFTDENETNIRTVEYVAMRALENVKNLTEDKSAILSSFAYLGDDGSDKVVDFGSNSAGENITFEGVSNEGENAGKVSGSTADTGLAMSLKNMKAGSAYTLTVQTQADALDNFKLVLSHKKDGSVYDGVNYYTKEKALTEDNGVYTATFNTAPVNFDEVYLELIATAEYSDFTITSMSVEETVNVEIATKPVKNQMVAGSTFDLDAKLNGVTSSIVWASSDQSVATVSKAGKLTALKAGKTEITATVTANGETYEDYFELYVWNETPSTEKAEPIYEPNAPVDFVLNVPTGREINILQLTDTQTIDYDQIREGVDLGGVAGRYGCENALYLNMEGYIDKVMAKFENTPIDLIVLTGDNIYGKFDDNGTMLDALIEKIDSLGIWWTFAFGNHDKESDIGIENILRKYSNSQYCLYAYSEVAGDSNISVAIKQGGEYKKVLYMLDTHSTGANRVDDYAYVVGGVYDSQKAWLAETNTAFTDYVGTQNVSAFAFLHIPFTAYVNAIQALELEVGYDVQDSTGTNFGGYYDEFTSAWDPDNSFFSLLKSIGVDGVFVGHQHTNSLSLVYDGVRLSYGLKTGTYDSFQYGDLGGTMITVENGEFDVEHVYAVSNHIEDFDLATPMASNHLETSTFWTASMHFDLSTTNKAEEMPVNGSGSAMKATKNESETGWAYLRFEMLPLKARQYYTVSFDLKFLDNPLAFNGYVTPNEEITASEAIYNVPVTTKDGHLEYTFRAPENTQTSSLYLSFYNWKEVNADGETYRGMGDSIIIDNVALTAVDAPIVTSIVGDDGSFEKDGTTVELYSPYASSLFDQWSKTVSLQYYRDPEGDTSVRVTSDPAHIRTQSNMYIKFNQPIVNGQQYKIFMDMTWFTESTSLYFAIYSVGADGKLQTMYGYEALKYNGTGKFTNETLPLALNGLTFTSTATSDCFYLRLHNNGTDGKAFDFTIDNIRAEMCLENIKRYTYSDTITLLSNHDSEIKDSDASWVSARSTVMNVVEGKVYVTSSVASATRNYFFIRFNTSIVKGQFYAITYDAEWLGENAPHNLYYSLDVGENQDRTVLQDYTARADLFATHLITFTAKADCDYFYLRIISDENSATESVDLFDFSICNIGLHTGVGAYQYSDTISLHTAFDSEITDSEAKWWFNNSKRVTLVNKVGEKLYVNSYNNSTDGSSCVYIKFNTAIVAGQSYTITYDAEWLGDSTAKGFHYSLEGMDQVRGSADGKGYHGSSIDELFVKKSITFTADKDQDYFYLRIINNGGFNFNFTIDNIALTANN